MSRPLARITLLCAGVFFLNSPALAGPPIEPVTTIAREYAPLPNESPLALGEFAPTTGLEQLSSNLDNRTLRILSLADGSVLGDFATASPNFNWGPGAHLDLTVLVRDLDHDGYGELLLVATSFDGGPQAIGAYGFQGGSVLTELWIRTQQDYDPGMIPDRGPLDVADLTADPVDQITMPSVFLFILDGSTGATLYTSESDDPVRTPTQLSVDDYDGDGSDEILATMACPSGCPGPAEEIWLIGGTTTGGGGGGGGGGGTPTDPLSPQLRLRASYPNPSSGPTSIAFATPDPGRVRLRIFDTAGRRVRTLIDTQLAPGEHLEHWDGHDARGVEVSSGTYFYEIDLDGTRIARKLLRVK